VVPVAGGFPIYVGDPEAYMHFRPSDPIKTLDEEKNAICILNELYYEGAVYADVEQTSELLSSSSLISVTVDGITAYGRGKTKKEAKLNAARAAVEQLRCIGLLEKRVAKKESVSAQRRAAENSSASEKPVPYRLTVCSAVADNAVAKLNRLYGPLSYKATGSFSVETGLYSFTVNVSVNGQNFTGTGKSKKVARLAASESALRAFNLWTAEDDDAKKKAWLAAKAALKMSSDFQPSAPQRGFGSNRAFSSSRGVRGAPVFRARGMAYRGPVPGRGAMQGRGSFFGSQTPGFPYTGFAQPSRGRGPASRARGSGMLSRGTRGRGGAAYVAAAPMEIPEDKNPIMLLNEVYYSAAVFEFSPDGEQLGEGNTGLSTCTLTVDGITVYGTGVQKKDAKLNAATAAVEQLKASGMLQKRLADKASFMSQKRAVQGQYHATVQSQAGAAAGPARMQRGRPTARVGQAPTARAGRAVTTRGGLAPAARGARVRGARMPGFRGRGVPSNQSWQTQTPSVDFTTFEDTNFLSFEHKMETAAASQFHDPWGEVPGAQAWYPKTSPADFMMPGDNSYGSFEPKVEDFDTGQFPGHFRGPGTAGRGRRPGRGFSY